MHPVTCWPLHLTVDPHADRVELVPYGTVSDGVPADRWRRLDDAPGVRLAHGGDGAFLGLVARGWSGLDVLAVEDSRLWGGPRLHVPALGLGAATPGEALLAVRGRYAPGEPTAGAMFLRRGRDAQDLGRAVGLFGLALEAGEMRALLWLGHTLCSVGEPGFAYDHLRRYTELAPEDTFAWCRLGEASTALGRLDDARGALERASALGGPEHRSAELLAALDAS